MLEVTDLELAFGEVQALAGASVAVPPGSVTALVGPSGCGKTTLLRVVAGLEIPTAGSVTWNGRDLAGVPAHLRRFGLMFQDYALFPHRSVGENVAFGLRMADWDEPRRRARVAEVLELVGLAGYDARPVGPLSGGEAQRVALARALAPRPEPLMPDEPPGSLHRALPERLLDEMTAIFDHTDLTVLYVTHDQGEAFAVADSVAVMNAGRVTQVGAPDELWHRPADEFVARFLGFQTILTVAVTAGTAATPWGEVPIVAPDGARRLLFRPDAFSLAPAGAVAGTVESAGFAGARSRLTVRSAGHDLVIETRHRYQPGDEVRLSVDPAAIVDLGPA